MGAAGTRALGTERSGRHPLSAARLPRVLSSGRRDRRVDTLAQRTLGRGRLFPPRCHLVREEDPGRIPLPGEISWPLVKYARPRARDRADIARFTDVSGCIFSICDGRDRLSGLSGSPNITKFRDTPAILTNGQEIAGYSS